MVDSNEHFPSTNLTIHLVEDIQTFENLREQWSTLLNKNSIQDVFLTWEWLFAFWKHYGKDKDLWLLTAWEDNNLVGIAPLMLVRRRKYGFLFRTLVTLGSPETDIGGFIIPDGKEYVLEAFCRTLCAKKKQWDVLYLNEFHQGDKNMVAIQNHMQELGLLTYTNIEKHYYVPTDGDWDSYFKKLSSNQRSDIRRRLRRMEEVGQVEHKCYRGDEVTWEHFETAFEINKYGQYPHIYTTQEQQGFQRELFDLMKGKNWIEFHFLYLDNVPIAFHYGFTFNNVYEDWRLANDKRHDYLAPGKVLLRFVIENCFKYEYTAFDFLRGAMFYKTRWNPQESDFVMLRATVRTNPIAALAFIWLPKLRELAGNPKPATLS